MVPRRAGGLDRKSGWGSSEPQGFQKGAQRAGPVRVIHLTYSKDPDLGALELGKEQGVWRFSKVKPRDAGSSSRRVARVTSVSKESCLLPSDSQSPVVSIVPSNHAA